jgi:vanillate O-demethylase monooxygenase subunit
MVWRTSAGRHVENILDLAHFPFVHPDTFGCPEAEQVEAHGVVIEPDAIHCAVGVTTRNPDTPDGPLYPDLGPLIRLGYRYRVDLPYRITLDFDFPDDNRRALHEVVSPTAPDRCTIFWLLLVDERLASSDEEELAFARRVFAEDQPIIESQPPGVPLDRRSELHVPADRLAVAYRRALREAGVPEGALV